MAVLVESSSIWVMLMQIPPRSLNAWSYQYSKNEVTLKKALGGTMQMQGFLKKNWWDNMFIFHAVKCA